MVLVIPLTDATRWHQHCVKTPFPTTRHSDTKLKFGTIFFLFVYFAYQISVILYNYYRNKNKLISSQSHKLSILVGEKRERVRGEEIRKQYKYIIINVSTLYSSYTNLSRNFPRIKQIIFCVDNEIYQPAAKKNFFFVFRYSSTMLSNFSEVIWDNVFR